ncbi:MAG: hypothetical protein ACE5OO_06605 [Candidatus Bathyarchaeia archaeon]
MDPLENLQHVREVFEEEAGRHQLKGVLGVASFGSVYRSLMPVQRRRLEQLCGRLRALMGDGSVISVAYAYPEYAIDAIARRRGDGFDKGAWNVYAREYRRLNEALNATAERLAEETGGRAIHATLDGVAEKVGRVEDYYGMAVSHRVAAEQAGIGWRGKNELIVNPRFSCAIRLASVVTELPLRRTEPVGRGCGGCRACLDACPFLRFKERLDNYREQCRRYIVHLDLESEVCGKCIKACYRDSVYSDQFKL